MMRKSEWNNQESRVSVKADSVTLKGNLGIPEGAQGVVLFAHGSGSSRHSPRNRYVAQVLRQAKLATLLIDLLTQSEEAIDRQTRHLRFDIGLLAPRLIGTADWLSQHPATRNLKMGYFGASTGSAAALVAAAERPDTVSAIVSRGGRPDLAGSALSRVQAPTLLIVGGNDIPVIGMNREAMAHLHTEKQLEIIPGATHLFEEPGALEEVALLASKWFNCYLTTVDEQNLHLQRT
ncbi:MAG: dienelactone hydrolase family protein [Xenococcaceae cyanobacterium]